MHDRSSRVLRCLMNGNVKVGITGHQERRHSLTRLNNGVNSSAEIRTDFVMVQHVEHDPLVADQLLLHGVS